VLPFLLGVLALATVGPARSLTGSWMFGADRPEPQEAVVVVAQRCWNADVAVRLVEKAGRVTGTITWIPAAQGVVPSHRRDESERLTGARVGDAITLTGEHRIVETGFTLAYRDMPAGGPTSTVTRVRYELHVDRKSGHLVGTRDGRPFWLAPIKVRPAHCGAPPP
jgi:hypothetical protein